MPVSYDEPPAKRLAGIALVIGNAGYRFVSKLSNPAHDAEDMEASFRRMGYDIVGGRSTGIDVDRAAFANCVKEFARRAPAYEVAVLYYAGHGIQFAGENYLVPIDANPQSEADISLELVALQPLIANTISSSHATVVILDACRNNPFLEPLQRALGARSAQVGSGLAEAPAGENTIIVFATKPNHIAYDGSGRNGVFTDALLAALQRPDRDIETILREVRSRVCEATEGMRLGKQVPWSHSSLLLEQFSLTGRVEEAGASNRLQYHSPAPPVVPLDPQPEPHAATVAPAVAAAPLSGYSSSVSIGSISNSEIRDIGTVKTIHIGGGRPLPPRGPSRSGH